MIDKQRIINRFRTKKGFTQEQMAEQLGISQNAYNKMENGRTHIKADRLKKIADILEKDINEFLIDDNLPTNCKIEQSNSPNSTGAINSKLTINQNEFEKERAVWQSLVSSLKETIASKEQSIMTMVRTIELLETELTKK